MRKQKYFISLFMCPHCAKDISVAYTKKAIKKIYKSTLNETDGLVGLETVYGPEGVLVCLASEIRADS